jgi:hypothetical protein
MEGLEAEPDHECSGNRHRRAEAGRSFNERAKTKSHQQHLQPAIGSDSRHRLLHDFKLPGLHRNIVEIDCRQNDPCDLHCSKSDPISKTHRSQRRGHLEEDDRHQHSRRSAGHGAPVWPYFESSQQPEENDDGKRPQPAWRATNDRTGRRSESTASTISWRTESAAIQMELEGISAMHILFQLQISSIPSSLEHSRKNDPTVQPTGSRANGEFVPDRCAGSQSPGPLQLRQRPPGRKRNPARTSTASRSHADGLCNVGAAANASVHPNFDPAVHCLYYFGQGSQRSRNSIELPSAMIRNRDCRCAFVDCRRASSPVNTPFTTIGPRQASRIQLQVRPRDRGFRQGCRHIDQRHRPFARDDYIGQSRQATIAADN